VSKALAKNREDRYQHIDDLIVDLIALKKRVQSGQPAIAPLTAQQPRWKVPLLYASLAITSTIAAALAMILFRQPAPGPIHLPVRRFSFTPESLARSAWRSVAVSPDGAHVIYMDKGGLVIRDLNREEPRILAGTEGADAPFWSPDSASIRFIAGGHLKKVAAARGAVVTICQIPKERREVLAAWTPDGKSIAIGQYLEEMSIVSALGGVLRPLGRQTKAVTQIRHLTFLPAESLPFRMLAAVGAMGQAKIVLRNPESGETHALTDGSYPVYSSSGHVVFQPSVFRPGIWGNAILFDEQEEFGRAIPNHGEFRHSKRLPGWLAGFCGLRRPAAATRLARPAGGQYWASLGAPTSPWVASSISRR